MLLQRGILAAVFRYFWMPIAYLPNVCMSFFERHAFGSQQSMHYLQDGMSSLSVEEASLAPPRRAAALIPVTMLAVITGIILWATFFKIDIIASGQGKVIPSTTVQQLSTLESGVVREILVKEGQVVQKGQALVRLDPVVAQGAVTEQTATREGLMAAIARLKGEASGVAPVYPNDIGEDIINEEKRVGAQRADMLAATLNVMREQRMSKAAEATDFFGRLPQYQHNLELLNEQMSQTEPLVKSGAAAPLELLGLQRERGNLNAQIISTRQGGVQANAQVAEIGRRIEEKLSIFRSEAREDLAKKQVLLNALEGSLSGRRDVLQRTILKSPVDGIVKTLHITTVGGIAASGKNIIDIVPSNDVLLVEVRVLPQDIAYIKRGSAAKVKITAFDSGALGAIDAKVERISPDSQADERSGALYYKIEVSTDRSIVSTQVGDLNILPGMIAEVDVITGHRSVISYVLRPIVRGMSKTMSER